MFLIGATVALQVATVCNTVKQDWDILTWFYFAFFSGYRRFSDLAEAETVLRALSAYFKKIPGSIVEQVSCLHHGP